ncbi:MAG: hypothetical protein C4293_16890 [Nitrospiraceae bacterium]
MTAREPGPTDADLHPRAQADTRQGRQNRIAMQDVVDNLAGLSHPGDFRPSHWKVIGRQRMFRRDPADGFSRVAHDCGEASGHQHGSPAGHHVRPRVDSSQDLPSLLPA